MMRIYKPIFGLLGYLAVFKNQSSSVSNKFLWLCLVPLATTLTVQPLKAQDNKQTRSEIRRTTWPFSLPANKEMGLTKISVDFEYYFFREPSNKNYASLNIKVKSMSINTGDGGTPSFKYKGRVYTGNELSAIDGLSNSFAGFDEIKINGIYLKVDVVGGSNPKRVLIGSYNISNPVKVTEINDNTDLNSLSLGWITAEATDIIFGNTMPLQSRIEKALRLTQDRERYKTIIREADAAFASKNFTEARSKYTTASKLLPQEQYPQDQLEKINDILEAEKTQTSKSVAKSVNANTSGRETEASGTKTQQSNGGSKSDDDWWGTETKTASGNTSKSAAASEGRQAGIPSNAPPMIMDNAGNHYVQNENGKYVKTDKATYDAVKREYNDAKNKPGIDAYNTQKKQDEQAAVDKFYAGQNDFLDNMKKQKLKDERDGQLMATSFYTAQASSSIKSEMNDLSRLDGSFESLEQLNAAFQQQSSSINRQKQQLTEAGRSHNAARMNYAFKDADAKTGAYKGLATALGSLASDAAAAREAREAKQRLQAEYEQQVRLMKKQKWDALLAMRTGLLEKFPDGGVPLSSHKVPGDNLYFFAYILSPDSVNAENPTVRVSDVYLIQRYSDGGWPFKNTIVNELNKAAGSTQNVVMVGYYTDKDQAVQMQEAFLTYATRSEMNVSSFTYKGKKSSGTRGNDSDFWGGGQQSKSTEQAKPENNKSKSDDDWWGSDKKPAKPATEKPADKKADDDFWK